MERDSIIRTIYLYTFSLLGLVLMTVGGVQFMDMALKAIVFKQADEEQRMYARQPPMAAMRPDMERWSSDSTLTEEQRATIRQWLADYENWSQTSAKLDPVAAQRQRTASTSLAFIMVGLPLYLLHWRMIKKRMSIEEQRVRD
jgi:hypothetical protein